MSDWAAVALGLVALVYVAGVIVAALVAFDEWTYAGSLQQRRRAARALARSPLWPADAARRGGPASVAWVRSMRRDLRQIAADAREGGE